VPAKPGVHSGASCPISSFWLDENELKRLVFASNACPGQGALITPSLSDMSPGSLAPTTFAMQPRDGELGHGLPRDMKIPISSLQS
jgi:hypothetical protein